MIMVSQESAPSAVTNNPPEAAPGIPAVEVDPTNELLDGENLDEKKAVLDEGLVQVDPSGRRFESVEGAKARDAGEEIDPNRVVSPPASANLELRKAVGKREESFRDSIGQGPEKADTYAAALEAERVGLQGRADDGDEKAAKRVKQVDEQLSARKKAGEQRSKSDDSDSTKAPEGRSAVPPSKQATAKPA
jgi:hypothetical protein